MKIAILLSGKGSDLINLYYKWFNIACVVTDRDCPGKDFALSQDIPCFTIKEKDKRRRSEKITQILFQYNVTHVILSGYLKIITEPLLSNFKVINIHPSYLPEFPGKDPQKQALQAGVKETGVTLHNVDHTIDGGQIIRKLKTPIFVWDTVDSLSHRLQIIGTGMLEEYLREEEECYGKS